MNQIVLTALASTGVGAIIAAIVTGLFSRRKLGAEATEIITKAAAGVVTSLQAEVARSERRAVAAENRLEKVVADHKAEMLAMATAHAKEREEVRRVLQLHVAWDSIAIAKMNDIGVGLPPAPPLLPANRYTDEAGFPNGI